MKPHNIRIVADENIPELEVYAGVLGSIQKVAAAQINQALLEHADALFVRSVTPVNAALLEKTSIRFVGSATAGIDHVDVDYLEASRIEFVHAPGSNAVSVVEYVLAALFVIATRTGRDVRRMTVGIIGCGHVGERLARRLEALGMRVLRNDPPRREIENGAFVQLDQLLDEADIVSIHTPLTRTGPFPTYHLLGRREFDMMKRGVWLINAARGSVLDSDALKSALKAGHVGAAAIDVWEHEPVLDTELLDLVTIGTPHIAGYSYDAKLNGRRQIIDALFRFLGAPPVHPFMGEVASIDLRPADPSLPFSEMMRYLIHQMYDITKDDLRLRDAVTGGGSIADSFRRLRREYPQRYSFSRYGISSDFEAAVEELGVGRSQRRIEPVSQVR